MRLVIVAVLAVLAAGCGSDLDASASENRGDASARIACDHFRNVAADADILSDAELRAKLAEVNDDAQVSRTSGISGNARSMLAAATEQDSGAFDAAVSGFGSACDRIGR